MSTVTFVMMQVEIKKHRLIFKVASGTSRGILKAKDSWFISQRIEDELKAIGECSIIEGLNPEDPEMMTSMIDRMLTEESIVGYPSVRFGLEMLEKSGTSSDPYQLFDTPFSRGEVGLPINGLIWMGSKSSMLAQIRQKLDEGYKCIKLKIGAIDFDEELSLLNYLRREYNADTIELRVDANGAFHPSDAHEKLSRLSSYQIHSIEQPIKQGQWEEMAKLCETTPIDIALDEELIGIRKYDEKKKLLATIKPQYIILKPSLVGGWTASDEWIELSESSGISWWATSALEANVGLNAIAQWTSSKDLNLPQGLGTGGLYTNNIESPLVIRDAALWLDQDKNWDLSVLQKDKV